MNIAEYLRRTAVLSPERAALFLGETCVATYGAFLHQAGQVAAFLQSAGVAEGAPVAIFMKNVPEYLVVQYGIWMAGAVAVPINAKLHGREAAWIIDNAEAEIVFTSPSLTEALEEVGCAARLVDVTTPEYGAILTGASLTEPMAREGDDLAWLFYTSGTTGRPKGVMITHKMLRSFTPRAQRGGPRAL